jgi:hypothetical protein
VICAFSFVMPARTVSGARTLEKVLGFEDFLAHVESDRFERVIKTPEMFEKFLPYAMALHVESKWVQAFAKIVTTPPNWYQGGYPGAYNAIFLVNSLNMMSSQQLVQVYDLRFYAYCSLAYSAFAAVRIGIPGSASFHSAKKS